MLIRTLPSLTALTAEFTVGEGELMTHDEPFFMAPDDKHDLISGTCSHLPFVKARYKGLLKNDNQLAMLFTLANLFRVDQMIRQWERSQ